MNDVSIDVDGFGGLQKVSTLTTREGTKRNNYEGVMKSKASQRKVKFQ